MKIAGVELESFPTTWRGKYVRGYRLKMPSYWRLLMPGRDQLRWGDEYWFPHDSEWKRSACGSGNQICLDENFLTYRRYVRGRG